MTQGSFVVGPSVREHWITSREFLSDCPVLVAELFHYWDERRGKRRMPARADISPAHFKMHLPDIVLVDVEGVNEQGVGQYRYRVVGTMEAMLRGHDPTGQPIEEGFFGPNREAVIDSYELVRRERTFLYLPFEFTTPEGRWYDGSMLYLPLSEDGQTVSQVLVYSAKREREMEE